MVFVKLGEVPRIESGIPGFDKLTFNKRTEMGGIPENTATLVYGPPKTGKSIFCYQFMYHGFLKDEPCLYLAADYGIKQLQQITMDFGWYLESRIQNQMLYIIDAISSVSGIKVVETANYRSSSVHNPTDIMVKLGMGTRFIFQKSPKFRSVVDSLTTLFAFNPDMLVVRFLKAYIKRLKEAGGTALIAHTEGIVNAKIEDVLKEIVDNVLRLDGESIIIEKMIMNGKKNAPYQITDKGIIV